tara:strand:- start:319 stop:915 length:597 start_codon:yes stop_codon:yes gene_type:complete
MVKIIDYGIGNTGSILNMLHYIGVKAELAITKEDFLDADKLILPGVGSFDAAMNKLNKLGFSELIIEKAESGNFILGICLGMQILGTESEEGSLEGLNLIPGNVIRFNQQDMLIPHMGWNKVEWKNSKVLSNELKENKFYFVHSYYFDAKNEKHVLGNTNYGIDFNSIIANKNIFGVQFHPEKSHRYGMQLLKNFCSL